jgi:hypothetical protein
MVRGERDLRAQQVAAGMLQFIERSGLCHGQQAERRVKCASLVTGLRCRQRSLCAARRVERQPGGPLQERSRRRGTTAALGPTCGLLKFGGYFLIRARRGLGTVPGPAIRIDSVVGGLGQRAMQLLPRLQRRPVGRRAQQRMPEPHPGAELCQPRLRRRPRRPGADRVPPGRPPHQHRIAGRIGRRQLHQPAGLCWQHLQLPGVSSRGNSSNASGFPFASAIPLRLADQRQGPAVGPQAARRPAGPLPLPRPAQPLAAHGRLADNPDVQHRKQL